MYFTVKSLKWWFPVDERANTHQQSEPHSTGWDWLSLHRGISHRSACSYSSSVRKACWQTSVQSGRWSGRSLSKLEMSSCCSPTEFYNVMSLSSLRIILKELRTERTSGPQRCVRSWARFYQAWVQRNTNTPFSSRKTEENILLDSGSPLNSQRIIYHYWFHAESIWQPLHVVHCYRGQMQSSSSVMAGISGRFC